MYISVGKKLVFKLVAILQSQVLHVQTSALLKSCYNYVFIVLWIISLHRDHKVITKVFTKVFTKVHGFIYLFFSIAMSLELNSVAMFDWNYNYNTY